MKSQKNLSLSFVIGVVLACSIRPVQAAALKRVLVLGDSLTEGLGVEREQAFPAVLAKRLAEKGHPDVSILNAGISGSTTASGVSRLRWQLRTSPDIVILALGANDGLRALPVAETQKNIAEMITMAHQHHIRVLLAGMRVPPNYGPTYAKAFDQIYPDLAAHYHVMLIPFLLEGIAGNSTLTQPDGLHPTAEGHRRIAELVLPYLLRLL